MTNSKLEKKWASEGSLTIFQGLAGKKTYSPDHQWSVFTTASNGVYLNKSDSDAVIDYEIAAPAEVRVSNSGAWIALHCSDSEDSDQLVLFHFERFLPIMVMVGQATGLCAISHNGELAAAEYVTDVPDRSAVALWSVSSGERENIVLPKGFAIAELTLDDRANILQVKSHNGKMVRFQINLDLHSLPPKKVPHDETGAASFDSYIVTVEREGECRKADADGVSTVARARLSRL